MKYRGDICVRGGVSPSGLELKQLDRGVGLHAFTCHNPAP
jgi:hypothetical protein